MKLSIIVPVYNVEDYIAKCLDSLIYDDIGDYEIILVNDGSTDTSGEIAKAYASRRPEMISVVNKENGGLGSARNAGIAVAKGENLLFVDSDDWLAPGAVPEIMESLKLDFQICLFDFSYVNSKGKVLQETRGSSIEKPFNLESFPGLILERHEATNKILKKSLFTDNDIRFPERTWFEDLTTVLKLYLWVDRIIYIPRCWYIYLRRPESIMNSKKIKRNLEMITAVDDVLAYYKKHGVYERYKAELEYMAFHNQFLTTSVRVNLLDPKSPILKTLREDFLNKFPDYEANAYFKTMPRRYRLLNMLIYHDRQLSLNLLLRLNEAVKRKNS